MTNEEIIEYVLEHVDIVAVVSQFVCLKPAGNDYVGTCPFHVGPGDFLVVSPQRQMYHCSKCGCRGGVTEFLMQVLHLSYNETIAWLGLHFNLTEVDFRQVLDEKDCNFTLFEANRAAEQYFIRTLRETEEGESVGMSYYDEKRHFTDDIIRSFGLGYDIDTPANGFYQSLEPNRFSDELLIRSFLMYSKNNVGPFHGRVVFPVYNVAGDVIAFSARTLKSKEEAKEGTYRKYVNTGYPEVTEGFAPAVYIKGDNLFGLYQAKESIIANNFCVLVEGNADAVSLHCHGITNCIASLGTALTPNQVQLIRRFTNNVILMYDGDSAGRNAMQKAIKLLIEGGMHVEAVLLPEGEDPDSFCQGKSNEELLDYFAANTSNIVDVIYKFNEERMNEDDEEFFSVLQNIELMIASVEDIAWRDQLAQACIGIALKIGIQPIEVRTSISDFSKQRLKKTSLQQIENLDPQPSKEVIAGKTLSTLRPLTAMETNLLRVLTWNFHIPIFSDGEREVSVHEFLLNNLDACEKELNNFVVAVDQEMAALTEQMTEMEQSENVDPSELSKQQKEMKSKLQVLSQIKAVYESCLFKTDSCFGMMIDIMKQRGERNENIVTLLANHPDKAVRDVVYSLCQNDGVVSAFFTKNRTLPENISEDFRQRLIEKEKQRKAENHNSDLQQEVTTVLYEFMKSIYDSQLEQLQKMITKYRLKNRDLRRIIQEHHVKVNNTRIGLVNTVSTL